LFVEMGERWEVGVGGGGGGRGRVCQTFNTSQITGNLKSFKESGSVVFNTEQIILIAIIA
jgi:hypothetical protein